VDPVATARREVAAAQERYYRAYLTALAAPGDQARVNSLLDSYTPSASARREVADWMSGLASRGYAGRAGSGSYYVIERTDTSSLNPDRVVATVCGFDDGVIFDARRRAPDGKEIVVDDKPVSERTLFTWVNRGGWKIDAVRTTDTWKGENRCPPRHGSS
jgi:hypothetical protein